MTPCWRSSSSADDTDSSSGKRQYLDKFSSCLVSQHGTSGSQLIQPKLQKMVKKPPATTSHASNPPSGGLFGSGSVLVPTFGAATRGEFVPLLNPGSRLSLPRSRSEEGPRSRSFSSSSCETSLGSESRDSVAFVARSAMTGLVQTKAQGLLQRIVDADQIMVVNDSDL